MMLSDLRLPEDARIIAVGNEKGGAGKTTLSIHIILSLLYDGHKVCSVDIDSRQRSISHYLENRRRFMLNKNIRLPFPSHFIVNKSQLDSMEFSQRDEQQRFSKCLSAASKKGQFIVIDTPGNDTFLSRLAHSVAHTIVTPINDSFVDLDVLGRLDPSTFELEDSGVYGKMITKLQAHRRKLNQPKADWVVLRNRLSNLDANNKRQMAKAVEILSEHLGFRHGVGFSERVIYRELFLRGLSLLDLVDQETGIPTSMAHIAARRELQQFMQFLNLTGEPVHLGQPPLERHAAQAQPATA